MTTFQLILFSVFQSVCSLLPVSVRAPQDFLKAFLDWTPPTVEFQFWVGLLGSLVLIFFFRFDWLGLISALLKSVVRPKSLAANERTLDQQIVLFLFISALPGILFKLAIHKQWIAIPEEFFLHPLTLLGVAVVSFGFLQAGLTLNKRMKGLNHLKLTDGVTIGFILLLTAHPAFSVVLLAMAAFAVTHYHAEAIFKYSLLMVTLYLVAHTCALGSETQMSTVFSQLGPMNLIVVTVLSLAGFWLTLENLQKSFTVHSFEKTFRLFRWFQLLIAIGYGVVFFLQRGIT